MTQPEQKVVIIIVNWNTDECLANCLRSLAALPEQDLMEEVIVVDNASGDRSVVKAQRVVGESYNQPKVRWIKNKKNLGFAAANNIGLTRLAERGSTAHVLLLNPDTVVLAGMISELREGLIRLDKVGIVGPKLLHRDGSLQPSVRNFPRVKELMLYMLKLGSLVKEEPIDYGREQEVEQVMGAAMLIKHECLQQVGRLDEKFFLWFDEVDYCRRAIKAGWQVWYTPLAQCIHLGGISFNQVAGVKKNWLWLRSVVRYARKYLSGPEVWLLMVMGGVNILLWLPALALNWGRQRHNEQNQLAAK